MSVLEPLILPRDVLIVPVSELPGELRGQIEHAEGDCSITRPRSRATTSIIDAATAALLERFRSPSTIVDAVIAHSAAAGVDPGATLDEAFVVLGGFVNDGLLVPAGSELARPIEATLVAGELVDGFEVVAPVHVILDTAVHIARSAAGEDVALKVARDGSQERMRAAFAHEAALLGMLDGRVTPRLLGEGEVGGRPFLAMSWCAGVDAYEAAEEARRLGSSGRESLLELVVGVVAAYAEVHAQGVLHADVHPRNVVVGGDGAVRIIDFGLADRPSPAGTVAVGGRGGVDLFVEPEVAAARLAGRPSPAVTAAGEQYSVAALVYLMLTGAHTHVFALEREVMLRQIAEQPPTPFGQHDVQGLAAVERVVSRALAKSPGERFASVAELCSALRDATADASGVGSRSAVPAPAPGPARTLLDAVLARLAIPHGELHAGARPAPTASVQNGAAGFAYGLLRIAGIRGDEALLGQADLWSQRALLDARTPDGFRCEELNIVPERFGRRSLYHAAPGVHAVAALVAVARGDESSRRRGVADFVSAADSPGDELDVAFGRAGLLVGCALLLEAADRGAPAATPTDDLALRRLGERLRDSLATEIAGQPEIARCDELRALGAAHGWAGLLFALLRWSQATGSAPGGAAVERLGQLAALGRPAGRGTVWPHSVGESPLENPLGGGWCNGAAGYVGLWTVANQLTGDDTFAGLARAAAWTAYEDRTEIGNLCCGLAGRAYALLHIYRQGGGEAWLARARKLADRAALHIRRDTYRRDSLYNGELGVAVLAADLEDPLHACMPLYEGERWTVPSR